MSTNDSTPAPTAGERPCDGRSTNVCVAEGCYGEACLRYPAPTANAASTPASEGLTEAEREALWAGIRRARHEDAPISLAHEYHKTHVLWAVTPAVERIIAARVADAEAKARADEREKIAQAITREHIDASDATDDWMAGYRAGLERGQRIATGEVLA